MMSLFQFRLWPKKFFDALTGMDFIALLALRIYLVPVFWMAGFNKLSNIEATAQWFGNPEWGLGLPFPTLMAYFAGGTELLGAGLLLLGLGVRLISIPLLLIMLVAIFAVHFDNGWLAIADASHPGTQRLEGFMSWLEQNYPKRHSFVTAHGDLVVLNNGVEFAVTYSLMLLVLLTRGAGKYLSLDYWIEHSWLRYHKKENVSGR